jgi:hypothetical protein
VVIVSGPKKLAEPTSPTQEGSGMATTTDRAEVAALGGPGRPTGHILATAEAELFERLGRSADDGKINPPIDRVYPLDGSQKVLPISTAVHPKSSDINHARGRPPGTHSGRRQRRGIRWPEERCRVILSIWARPTAPKWSGTRATNGSLEQWDI